MQSFIKSVLDEEAFYELILRNPAAKVSLPKKEDEESKGVFLDAKEAIDVYTHISNTRKNNMAKDIQNTFSL
ncbi:MAG: hypothetical protein RUMPE_01204 [Eubacteriales bacterium SKADARSKE-1]|nr:hypothetical protein [Eubacteriales bacterium SKADARSKE-1]MDQ5984168.1 hypothetical protein [Eubacteriales bacterium SKADARSKE-1]